jgi:DNA transposition AAA+ family ATPase
VNVVDDSSGPADNPQPISPRNELIGRERIRGATRMIAEGTDAAQVTDEQITAVAQDVDLFRKAHKITTEQIARGIGYDSPGVISEFLKGSYKGNRAKVAMALESWLVEEEHRRSRPETTQFVWTNVAMQMKGVAGYALDKKKIAMVYGPDASGVGKTMALRAIHQEMGPRRSTLVTIDKVDANPTGLLKKILQAMRKEDRGTNFQRQERIVKQLLGRNHLLMIDQIHNLRGAKEDKPFYILADIYDATNTAQLWCGTADLVTYLDRQQHRNADESLAQLRRRIFPRVDLMAGLKDGGRGGSGGELLVTVDQVREAFGRHKLKLTERAARWMADLCNLPDSGSFGLVAQLFEYAEMLAELRDLRSIDLPLLQEALRSGFSATRAEALMSEVEDGRSRRMAKVG